MFVILRILSFLYVIAAPIFLSIVIFLCIEPLATWFHLHGLRKTWASTLSLLLFLGVTGLLLAFVGATFVSQFSYFILHIQWYGTQLQRAWATQLQQWQAWLNQKGMHIHVSDAFNTYINHWLHITSQNTDAMLSSTLFAVTNISQNIITVVIGILLAYFLSIEQGAWRVWYRQAPQPILDATTFLREQVISRIAHFLRAQVFLISLTFLLADVWLSIMHITSALTFALLIAVSSVVPLIGMGVVFVPWILFLWLSQHNGESLWICVMYVCFAFFRQMTDPRVIGKSLGVSAYTMLALIVVFYSLFGIVGVIASPFLTILLQALYKNGYLKKWIHFPIQKTPE